MTTAVVPGSFDPVTLGHVDIVERAAKMFSDVVVCVVHNPNKSGTFTIDERLVMLNESIGHLPNVRFDSFSGLLVDYCSEQGANAIIKGLRNSADFDYELPMAHMNQSVAGIDTVFIATRPELSFVSSSLCREVAKLGGNVEKYVPATVNHRFVERYS